MRAWIYNKAIGPLTVGWYEQVLQRLSDGSHMLDVGIGPAGALIGNAKTVRSKSLRVTGVDIDEAYIRSAERDVAHAGLADQVEVILQSVYDHQGGPYDAAYFAASFMLMPDPPAALEHVKGLLRPNGRIFFTQTFEEKKSLLAEKTKPLLKMITTIDFGRVTYEKDFLAVIEASNLEVEEFVTMGTRGPRSFKLAVTRPRG